MGLFSFNFLRKMNSFQMFFCTFIYGIRDVCFEAGILSFQSDTHFRRLTGTPCLSELWNCVCVIDGEICTYVKCDETRHLNAIDILEKKLSEIEICRFNIQFHALMWITISNSHCHVLDCFGYSLSVRATLDNQFHIFSISGSM